MKLEPRKSSNPYSTSNQAAQTNARVQSKQAGASSGNNKGGRRGRQDSSDDDDDEPKKKKAAPKKSRKKDKGKQKQQEEDPTGPSVFLTLPLDILHETCTYLDPGTVLALARTCSSLRSVLMSKKSAPNWIAARRAVALPDLGADDLSEPMIAHLATDDRVCQLCGAVKASEAEQVIRVRACTSCFRKHLLIKSKLIKQEATDEPDHPAVKIDDRAFEVAFSTPYAASGDARTDGQHYYWRFDVLDLNKQLADLEEQDVIKSAAMDVEHIEQEAGADNPEAQDRDASSVEAFVMERKELIAKVQRDAAKIYKWQNTAIEDSIKAQDDLIASRKAAIVAKVVALGHLAIDFGYPFDKRDVIEKPEPLTEQDWTTVILPIVIPYVKQRKENRLYHEEQRRIRQRQVLIHPYYQALRNSQQALGQNVFPTENEFLQLPTVTQFWQVGAVLTSQTWTTSTPTILRDVETFKLNQKRHAVALLNKVYTSERDLVVDSSMLLEDELDQVLGRAVNGFACSLYNCATLSFSDIIVHRLTHNYHNHLAVADLEAWFNPIADLLDDMALDPSTTTHSDMERLGSIFTCETGHNVPSSLHRSWARPVFDKNLQTKNMNWSAVLSHSKLPEHTHKLYRRLTNPMSLSRQTPAPATTNTDAAASTSGSGGRVKKRGV